MKVENMTPTWEALLPLYLSILETGPEAAKVPIRKEMFRLAQAVDSANKVVKSQAEEDK